VDSTSKIIKGPDYSLYMRFRFLKGKIELEKEINDLDRFVADFVKAIDGVKYVIVSGYPAILFSRPRMTEDVDLIVERLSLERFVVMLKGIMSSGFECLSPEEEKELYEILVTGEAIRFARHGVAIPNIELKFAQDQLDELSLKDALSVHLDSIIFKISPLELQIVYKLYLGKGGNEKDIEDARFLYRMFKDHLDMKKLSNFMVLLKVHEMKEFLED
jgi:hypothetical protein